MHRPRRRWLSLACIALVGTCVARPLADADVPITAQNGSAFITHQPGAATWAIGNATIQFVVGFDASMNLVPQSLTNPATGAALDIDQTPDTSVTIGGDRLTLNESNPTMSLVSTSTDVTDTGVRLAFTFEHRVLHTTITRTYVCYDGSPTIETWTTLQAPSGAPPVDVSNLSGWQLTMPNASVKWINGLRGDSATQAVPPGDSFAFDGGALDDGETDIGSTTRSSEVFVPVIFIEGPQQQFYGGVIWSGSWQIAMTKSGDRVQVAASFPGISTSLTSDRALELPHTFFGVTDAGGSATDALRQFVFQGIRRGRLLTPLVTYNTWFPYGASITEADVDEEMHRASAIGVEMFVLDAGWWVGAGTEGQNDFSTGLGSYLVDTDRFPAQLLGLADQAHSLNMSFGLWVEPERVDLSLAGRPGMVQEPWLATVDGSYDGDGKTAQICLASPAARKWVFTQIAALIDRVHPDYIKWDNNFWINCDRSGHGHGATDGNFQHVLGLYALLDELRQRYPNLLIENVSGGGNRLDYGMMAYTDSAWMDDSSSPSAHVRHNLEGLSAAFPPSYLLSFVIDSADESIYDPDLAQIMRSRMPGALGLTYRYTDIDDDLRFRMAAEIAEYKLLRGTVTQSFASLLTNQAPVQQDGWDVLQETSQDWRNAIVFAFKNDADDGQTMVYPQNLEAAATYDVSSLDGGDMGTALGADLMRSGILVIHGGDMSRAHVLLLSEQ